jgi:hypothetical protein
VDDATIAVAYNPLTEGDENSTADTPCEIHFYKLKVDGIEIDKKIQIPGKFLLASKMHFNKTINSFVIFHPETGVSVISPAGQVVYKNDNLKMSSYSMETGLFLTTENKTIMIYKIID